MDLSCTALLKALHHLPSIPPPPLWAQFDLQTRPVVHKALSFPTHMVTGAQILMEGEKQIFVMKAKVKLMCFSDGASPLLPAAPSDSLRPLVQQSVRQRLCRKTVYLLYISTKFQHAGKTVPLSNAILTSSIRSLNPETLYSPSELRPAMNILTRLKLVLIFTVASTWFFPWQVFHLRQKKQKYFKSLIRFFLQNETLS